MIRIVCVVACLVATSVAAAPSRSDVCEWAPSKRLVTAIPAATAVGTGVGVNATILGLGATVVPHSSGAAILTGSGGYIAGSMGLATALPFITGIAVIVGGAGVLVEVGCVDLNHADALRSARQFYRDSPQMMRDLASDGREYILHKAAQLKRFVPH